MADNTLLNTGAGGDTIRDKDRAGVKTQIVALDLNPAGTETLMAGLMPISATSLPLPASASQDGTDITTPTAMPAGGVGIRGWLSAIWTKLNGVLDISDRAARLLGVLSASANIIGKVGIDQTTDGTTNAVRLLAETTKVIGTVNIAANQTVNTNLVPATTGGLSTFHLVSAATTNLTTIKASAGQVYGWYIYNSNAAARKVAFHNLSTAPVAGASIFMTLVIPPNSGANVEISNGIVFSSGIGISTVTGLTDADATAVALNDLVINIFWK